MHRWHQSNSYMIGAVLVLCLASGQAVGASASSLSLDPSAWPAGVTSPSQYEAYVQTRLNQLQDLAGRQTAGPAKVQACLTLASFALTRGTEPALSEAWLGMAEGRSRPMAENSLKLAGDALSQVETALRDRRFNQNDAQPLARQGNRLMVLAAMQSCILGLSGPADALEAARQADVFAEGLPEASQSSWNLLISGCLNAAGRGRDAQVRLRGLLRDQADAPLNLAARILMCRTLSKQGCSAAAAALVSKYLQSADLVSKDDMTSEDLQGPSGADGAAVSQPGEGKTSSRKIVRCTLLLVKANLLADWAKQLALKEDEPRSKETAEALTKESADYRAQAIEQGPYVVRLAPILDRVGESAGL